MPQHKMYSVKISGYIVARFCLQSVQLPEIAYLIVHCSFKYFIIFRIIPLKLIYDLGS